MTNQPGRVRIQQDADSERSWGFRTDARLQWMMTNLASLDAPVWQVMMVLIKYADEAGRTFPAVRTIGDSLARIHRFIQVDGVRTAEGCEGVTGAIIRA